jgi:hypothetical protein
MRIIEFDFESFFIPILDSEFSGICPQINDKNIKRYSRVGVGAGVSSSLKIGSDNQVAPINFELKVNIFLSARCKWE